VLDLIERAGNKVPHPAILFLALCVAVIVLSQILYLADARITAEVVKPPPATVLAAFRVGDSPGNVINPDHAVLPPDRGVRPSLRQAFWDRHGNRADGAVLHRDGDRLDAVLHRLVLDRHSLRNQHLSLRIQLTDAASG